ncbi:MAG: sodium:calcium antiporter [Syntrophomonadaceae bacterium]|nr:sodium:calcium antiporter [Syntrophomonadaceae bacterium]MDD3888959.1 sodium:calcium antiporter [Syntrophomonadaceae bacterium]MDD4548683.1 sodium:calcium antiporter [Syntrophomonadaceae bacterium]
MGSIAILVISLGIILIGAEVFVNGVEWLGKKLNLSEGAVGSVLAAVGTALPETLIPIIAIVFGAGQSGHDIGIGAILGAPLMLSTLAMFITGLAVVIFSRRRMHGAKVVADYSTMSRDLGFFIIIYSAAVLTGLIPPQLRVWQLIVAGIMVLAYCFYIFVMLSQERDIEADHEMPVCYFDRKNAALSRIIIQVLVALGLIILGANLFVNSVQNVATIYQVPAFVLALIITPIATELPEKFNSVIWVSREKDTLALGNITGAMVFQSSLIPALGIFLTSWQLNRGALVSAMFAIISASVIYIELRTKKHISAPILMVGGIFYVLFIIAVVQGIIR